MAVEERVVVHIDLDTDPLRNRAKMMALSRMYRQHGGWDKWHGDLLKIENIIKKVSLGFLHLFKTLGKIGSIGVSLEFGLMAAALASVRLLMISGRWVANAYAAALTGVGIAAGAVTVAIGLAAAAMRQFKEASLAPIAGGMMQARGLVRSTYSDQLLSFYGMGGIEGAVTALAKTGARLPSSAANILRSLGNFTQDAAQLANLATVYGETIKSGAVSAENYAKLIAANPVFEKAIAEMFGGEKAGKAAGEGGKVLASHLVKALSGALTSTDLWENQLDTLNRTLFGRIKGFIPRFVNLMATVSQSLLGPMTDTFTAMENTLHRTALRLMTVLQAFGKSSLFPGLESGFERLNNWIVELVTKTLPRMDEIGERFHDFWLGTKDFFNNMGTVLRKLEPGAKIIIEAFGPAFKAIFGAGPGGAGGLIKQIAALAEKHAPELKSFGDSLASLVRGIMDIFKLGNEAFFDNLPTLREFVDVLTHDVVPAIKAMMKLFKDAVMSVLPMVGKALTLIANSLTSVAGSLSAIVNATGGLGGLLLLGAPMLLRRGGIAGAGGAAGGAAAVATRRGVGRWATPGPGGGLASLLGIQMLGAGIGQRMAYGAAPINPASIAAAGSAPLLARAAGAYGLMFGAPVYGNPDMRFGTAAQRGTSMGRGPRVPTYVPPGVSAFGRQAMLQNPWFMATNSMEDPRIHGFRDPRTGRTINRETAYQLRAQEATRLRRDYIRGMTTGTWGQGRFGATYSGLGRMGAGGVGALGLLASQYLPGAAGQTASAIGLGGMVSALVGGRAGGILGGMASGFGIGQVAGKIGGQRGGAAGLGIGIGGGALGGAAAGMMYGGPWGALAGGILGAASGVMSFFKQGDMKDKGRAKASEYMEGLDTGLEDALDKGGGMAALEEYANAIVESMDNSAKLAKDFGVDETAFKERMATEQQRALEKIRTKELALTSATIGLSRSLGIATDEVTALAQAANIDLSESTTNLVQAAVAMGQIDLFRLTPEGQADSAINSFFEGVQNSQFFAARDAEQATQNLQALYAQYKLDPGGVTADQMMEAVNGMYAAVQYMYPGMSGIQQIGAMVQSFRKNDRANGINLADLLFTPEMEADLFTGWIGSQADIIDAIGASSEDAARQAFLANPAAYGVNIAKLQGDALAKNTEDWIGLLENRFAGGMGVHTEQPWYNFGIGEPSRNHVADLSDEIRKAFEAYQLGVKYDSLLTQEQLRSLLPGWGQFGTEGWEDIDFSNPESKRAFEEVMTANGLWEPYQAYLGGRSGMTRAEILDPLTESGMVRALASMPNLPTVDSMTAELNAMRQFTEADLVDQFRGVEGTVNQQGYESEIINALINEHPELMTESIRSRLAPTAPGGPLRLLYGGGAYDMEQWLRDLAVLRGVPEALGLNPETGEPLTDQESFTQGILAALSELTVDTIDTPFLSQFTAHSVGAIQLNNPTISLFGGGTPGSWPSQDFSNNRGRDTASPRGDSASSRLAATLGFHGNLNGSIAGTRSITSAYRNFALGSINSDHLTGRAYDMIGQNLGLYQQAVGRSGGFAEFHGTGGRRHLHVVPPIGDSASRRALSGGGGGDTIYFNITAGPNASAQDIANEVMRKITKRDRERAERA